MKIVSNYNRIRIGTKYITDNGYRYTIFNEYGKYTWYIRGTNKSRRITMIDKTILKDAVELRLYKIVYK